MREGVGGITSTLLRGTRIQVKMYYSVKRTKGIEFP